MARIFVMVYAMVSYAVFFATFLYLFGFTGDIFVPKSVSSGDPVPGPGAWILDLALIALFGIQHSIMARPTFKKWWTQIIPHATERSTFVLIGSLMLVILYIYWVPLPGVLWNVEGTFVASALWGIFMLGMVIVLASSFMINHFDLFGLRQAFHHFQGKEYQPVPFKVTGLYKWVRNPLMLGFLMSFWAAPVMTMSRFVFAGGMTLYIFIGMYFEERNIAEHLGEPYLKYRSQTSMILPWKKAD